MDASPSLRPGESALSDLLLVQSKRMLLTALDQRLENLKGMLRHADHIFNLVESLRKNDNGKL